MSAAPVLMTPGRGDESVPAAALRHAITRGVLLAGFLVAVGLLFHRLVTIVAAGVITIIFAMLFSVVAAPLERRGVPRPLGAFVGVLALVGLVAGLLALVVPTLASQAREFAERLPEVVDDLAVQVASLTGSGGGEGAGERFDRSADRLLGDPSRLLGPLASVGMGVAGVLSALAVIVLTAFFMAARPDPLVGGVLRLFPPERRAWAGAVFERLRLAWTGWMRGVLIDMAVTGVLLWIGLTAIGLDYAIMFAALSALLVVVPYFGAIVAGIPPVLLGFTESTELGLLTMGVYLLVQQIESNVVVPLIMARQVKLHPAVIAVGVVVVSQLFGLVGVLVAVPLAAAFVILVEEIWVRPLERRHGIATPDVLAVERGGDGPWRRLRRERLEREDALRRGEARLQGRDPDTVEPASESHAVGSPRGPRRFLTVLGAPVVAISLAVTAVAVSLPALVEDVPVVAAAAGGLGAVVSAAVVRGRRMPFVLAAAAMAAGVLAAVPPVGSLLVLGLMLGVLRASWLAYYGPGRPHGGRDALGEAGLGSALAAVGLGLGLWRPVPFLLAAFVLAVLMLWSAARLREPQPAAGAG